MIQLSDLSDYDEFSYCEKEQMWYEDAKEVLPQPEGKSEVVSDLICEIKVNHCAYLWDEVEDWEQLEEEKDELEEFAQFVIGDNKSCDCTDNAFMLKTPQQYFITGFNDYGLWSLEKFIEKLKKLSYATEYFENGGALKFIAWTDENNQTRFVIHSYNNEYKYLKTIFDIIIDRSFLAAKLENILKIWKETVYKTIKEQEIILNKRAENPNMGNSVNHFFPEFRTPVKKVIDIYLKYFERKHGIRILFAIENGSRAWNMASKNSDYNIRFVFKRKTEDYISLNKPPEVIEEYLNEEYHNCSPDKALIAIVGFDLNKYLGLLSKSNPTCIEYLMSDIIYYGSNNLSIKEYIKNNFNPKTLIYHYISICKRNYNCYISKNKKVTHKMYLYVIRGLFNALFIYKKEAIPPLNFIQTIEILKDDIPTNIYEKIKETIKIKSSGFEKDTIERIEILDTFIEGFLNKTFDNITERNFDINVLNKYLRAEIFNNDKIFDVKNLLLTVLLCIAVYLIVKMFLYLNPIFF